jgi:hypothetical protein
MMSITMYVAPIANITAIHNVNHAQYADDTQLYISLEGNGSVSAINDCFLTLRRWFDSNGLSLNPDKSEAIIIGTAARHRSEGAIEAVTPRLITRCHLASTLTLRAKQRAITSELFDTSENSFPLMMQ